MIIFPKVSFIQLKEAYNITVIQKKTSIRCLSEFSDKPHQIKNSYTVDNCRNLWYDEVYGVG